MYLDTPIYIDILDCPPGVDDLDYNCGFGGTSAATPLVAGIASLLIARDPTIPVLGGSQCVNPGIYDIIRGSAVQLSATIPDPETGWGRADAYRAVLSIARGDANNNDEISIGDIGVLVDYKFSDGPAPFPDSLLGDVNCDGQVTIGDINWLVDYLFVQNYPLCIPCYEFND